MRSNSLPGIDASAHRVLFVTPVAPDLDAREGGSRVMAQLIAAVATRHSVGIAYFRGEHDPVPGPLVQACDLAVELPRPRGSSWTGRWTKRVQLAGGLLAGRPLWAGRWWVPRHLQGLRSIVEHWKPDVVQFEYHITGQYARALRGCQVGSVLVDHDPGIIAAAPGAPLHLAQRLIGALDRRAWRAYEHRIIADVDRVVVFSEDDRAAVRPLAGDTPVACIPFGTDIPAIPCNPIGFGDPNLLFVGSFRHQPNVDAALRLVNDIFPLVRAECGRVTLTIIGGDPPDVLRAAASESVEVLGSVPDVRPFLDRAAIVMAPIDSGGGMRVKVLEALAAGKALVCSRRAVAGLAVRSGEHVRLAETPGEFARASLELLASEDARAAMAGRARAWACAHIGWASVLEQYEALYDRLSAGVASGPAPTPSGTVVT
jgi:glycosyltransferase involved in cell wall biosynthesis